MKLLIGFVTVAMLCLPAVLVHSMAPAYFGLALILTGVAALLAGVGVFLARLYHIESTSHFSAPVDDKRERGESKE